MKYQYFQNKLLVLLFAMLVNVSNASFANDLVYVSSVKAKLMDSPKFKGNSIASLSKGDKLTVVGKKGPWLNVQTADQKTGWVSKFLTKKNPPNDRITVLPGDSKVALQDVRRRTSTITTAAAARGLSTLEKGSEADKFKSDPAGVKYMESFQMNTRELRSFASEIVEGAK